MSAVRNAVPLHTRSRRPDARRQRSLFAHLALGTVVSPRVCVSSALAVVSPLVSAPAAAARSSSVPSTGGIASVPNTMFHAARQGRRIGRGRGRPGRAGRRVRRLQPPPARRRSPRSRDGAVAGYPQQNVLPVWPDNPNDALGRDRRHPVRRDRAQAERAAGREQPRLGPRRGQVVGRPRPLRRRRSPRPRRTPRPRSRRRGSS